MLTDVFEEHRLLLDEQIVWSSNVARGRFTERYADWFAYKLRSILVCRYLFERRAPAKLRDVVVLDYHVLCRTLNPDIGRKAENLFSTNKLRIARRSSPVRNGQPGACSMLFMMRLVLESDWYTP